MSASQRDRGKVFPLSTWRVALRSLAFFLALGFGVLVAYFGVAIIHAELTRGQESRWALLFCCGLPLFLAGLVIVVAMAVVQANLLLNLARGERLLVGERALQSVTRGGRVLNHIPYDNMERVRVLDVVEQRGARQIRVRKVEFVVFDDKAAGTVLGLCASFSPGKRRGEYYIEPVYRASPDQIGQALLKRWRKYQERHEQDQEDPDQEDDEESL
jgi:hypothetical protein